MHNDVHTFGKSDRSNGLGVMMHNGETVIRCRVCACNASRSWRGEHDTNHQTILRLRNARALPLRGRVSVLYWFNTPQPAQRRLVAYDRQDSRVTLTITTSSALDLPDPGESRVVQYLPIHHSHSPPVSAQRTSAPPESTRVFRAAALHADPRPRPRPPPHVQCETRAVLRVYSPTAGAG